MELKDKRVLITGISGFTGAHLKYALTAKGAIISGISNEPDCCSETGLFYAPLEDYARVRDAISAIRPEYIIHLAGLSFAALEDQIPYYAVNVLGTQNLLNACIDTQTVPQKILLASSAAVYGDPGPAKVSESQEFSPLGHYGCSKLTMEFIAQTYMDELPILITRPFNYTGIGQPEHFLIPKIVKHFRDKEKTIELGNINITREFSDVRDVVSVYLNLLSSDWNGITNLCSGVGHTFEDLIQTCIKLSGHEIKILQNPKFIRKNDIKKLVGDPAHLNSLIDYKYKYSLEDLLNEMLSFK